MNTTIPNNDIPRLLRNLIRIGTVAEVDLDAGTCRVNTGGNVTDWLHWLTSRAGRARSWWAPSAGEQVLLFCLGGELDTAFVMPGVFSDEFPAPSASADAVHVTFPDGAVIEYEPKTGALLATGIKSATVNAADKVAVTAPLISAFFAGVIEGLGIAFAPVKELFAPLKPVFDWLGDKLKMVWQWFKDLIEPVKSTQETLNNCKDTGVMFGQAIANALSRR